MKDNEYSFENDGIAAIIRQNLLKVPPNQRPYAWNEEHIRQLLSDVKEAIYDEENQYILGTVVLVESDEGRRLGEDEDARSVTENFLKKYIRRQKDEEYLIQLNTMDDEFFRSVIVDRLEGKSARI